MKNRARASLTTAETITFWSIVVLLVVQFFLTFVAPSHAQRTFPTADVTMYVAPASCGGGYWPLPAGVPVAICGSDVTGDGSMFNPFATPQKAHDTLMAFYDFQCRWKPTIQLAVANAPGQFFYPGVLISGRLLGQCGTVPRLTSNANGGVNNFILGKYLPYTLRGDPANVTGAFFYPGAGGRPNQPCISLTEAAIKVEGLTCDTASASTANADCIDVFVSSFMDMSNFWFGNCKFLGIGVAWNSVVLFTGPITITGSAGIAWMQVAHSTVQGNSDSGSPLVPVSILGNPSFPQGFIICDHGVIYRSTLNITGAFTGPPISPIRYCGYD